MDRNQSGWARALPHVHFNLMNMINGSTGFSPFQLRMGHSPWIIPPLTESVTVEALSDPDATAALALIEKIKRDVIEAQDNLLAAKISQAEFANRHRGDEVVHAVGDCVMLSTEHRRREYLQKHDGCVAKFMPRSDGPFLVTKAYPEKSSYTLELPNELNCFMTFHASHLCKYIPNDDIAFPSRALAHPGPIITPTGKEEWLID